MRLQEIASQLFEYSERLGTIRNNVLGTIRAVNDYDEQRNIAFAVKEIDIIRITLLYEYELLETSNIVQDEYLSAYHARRVEILAMTKEQIRGHYKELRGVCENMAHKEALGEINRAAKTAVASLKLFDRIIGLLEKDIMTEGKNQTTH